MNIHGTKSFSFEDIHWMGFKRIIFVWDANKYSNTPSLQINTQYDRF